jgi:hypothetical protein
MKIYTLKVFPNTFQTLNHNINNNTLIKRIASQANSKLKTVSHNKIPTSTTPISNHTKRLSKFTRIIVNQTYSKVFSQMYSKVW